MKLLTITIPCYNSEEYMEHCIETLLPGGDQVEILIVNDGSSDRTREIADRYQAEYPGIVRAIHKENGGHGSAVNTGIANATGLFFKVVDSDDWVDADSYREILDFLDLVAKDGRRLDMLISNYVYEKVGASHKKVMKPSGFPVDTFFSWDDVKHIRKFHYILMHSIIYRTALLRECGLHLPEHTFYVDNLYAFHPLPFVKSIFYLDVDFYRYFIGRSDQSVNENVMVKRQDQQLRVNRLMIDEFTRRRIHPKMCRHYMRNYLEIVTAVTFTVLMLDGSREASKKREELWRYIRRHDRRLYAYLRRSPVLRALAIPGKGGHMLSYYGYRLVQKIYGFN